MGSEDPLARAELTFLLGMAFQLLHGEFLERLRESGYSDLRPVHGMLFQALGRGGATSTELAERLGVTKQATGQIITYLEEHGYVERRPHPEGGRRRLVVITDKAVKHMLESGRVLHELEAKLESSPGAPSFDELRRHLAMLIRELAGEKLPPLRPLW